MDCTVYEPRHQFRWDDGPKRDKNDPQYEYVGSNPSEFRAWVGDDYADMYFAGKLPSQRTGPRHEKAPAKPKAPRNRCAYPVAHCSGRAP